MTDRAESARASNQLTFGDLTDYPVMAQALDNQWLPPDLAAAQQRPHATKGSTPKAVAAASAELRRSLVNSGTLVINRAYLLNNEALYRNYRPGIEPAEREAFVRLLNDRALVPYLYQERDPGEESAWSKDKQVQQSWRRLLADEAEPACVRFDWDDDTNREETQKVSNYFSTSLSTLRRLKIPQLAKDLGISQERARALREESSRTSTTGRASRTRTRTSPAMPSTSSSSAVRGPSRTSSCTGRVRTYSPRSS